MLREPAFYYEGEGVGGGGAPAPAAAPAPVSAPPPSAGSAPAIAPSAPADQWTSVRDAFKPHGFDFGQYQDDESVIAHVAGVLRQYQQALPQLQQFQQVQPHLSKFQEWMATQNQPKKDEGGWKWKAPNYDPALAFQVARDASGNLIPAPGAPSDAVLRYQQGQKEFADTLHSFFKDPLGTIWPGIEGMVKPIVEQMIAERLRSTQDTQGATEFLQQNSQWLFNHDANQQPVRDPLTGRVTLSPLGHQFHQLINEAAQIGITDQNAQKTYALRFLQAQVARPAPTPEDTRKNFLEQAAAASRQGTPPPSAPTAPVNSGRLFDRAKIAMKANGISLGDQIPA